jgi:4-coumarate--CoA ligase
MTTVHHDEKTGIYKSDYDFKPVTECSFYEKVLGKVTWDENVKTYTETASGRVLTNSSLKLQAQQLGVGLLKNAGLKSGQNIMMVSGNCIEFPIVLFAAAFAGLKVALANPAYLTHELKHVIALTDPVKIFVMSPLIKSLEDGNVSNDKMIMMDKEISGLGYMRKYMVSESEAKQAKPYQPKDLNETQLLPLSSGTTGLPKAVEVTHRNVVAMMESIISIPNSLSAVKRQLNILPFYHCFALLCDVCCPIINKSSIWIMSPPFDPVKYCKIVEEEKIEAMCIVPPLFIVLTNTAQANKDTWKSVKFVLSGA